MKAGEIMGVVARLKKGDLSISGSLDERSPPITNGLTSYYPFDGTTTGKSYNKNLLNYSTWVVGTSGSQPGFTQNGETAANSIITFTNPWGLDDTVWANLGNDATSDGDGGWNANSLPIDKTKKYRLTVWIRRENAGDGRTYFGCQANTVCNLGTTTKNSNPYFYNALIGGIPRVQYEWTLWVAYIHPETYAGTTDPTSGIYTLDGSKTYSGFTDYKWASDATVGGHRTYLYYSTSTLERQYYYRPRFEVCDGTEATIADLLAGYDDNKYPTVNSNVILNNNSVGLEEAYTNRITNGCFQGGNHVTQWSGAGNSYGTYSIVQAPNPMQRVSRYVLRQSGGAAGEYEIQMTGMTANTTYRLTLWVYHSPDYDGDKQTLHSRWYTSAGTQGGVTTGQGTLLETWNGWEKRYIEFTTGTDLNGNANWFLGYPTGGTRGYRLITGLQCVAKGASTSWVDTSAARGQLAINSSSFSATGGSMVFWAKRTNPALGYKSLFGNVWTSSNAFFVFTGTSTDKLYVSYPGTDGTNKNVTPSNGYIPPLDQWIHYAVVWDSTSIQLYADGVAVIDSGVVNNINCNTIYTSSGTIFLGSHSDASYANFGEIKNVITYSRKLSLAEVKKLRNTGFSINASGNALTHVIEKPNDIPSDAIHFPFDINGKDLYRQVSPSTEANTIYEGGSVWVGAAITNLVDTSVNGAGEVAHASSGWGGNLSVGDLVSVPNPINAMQVAHAVLSYDGVTPGGAEFGQMNSTLIDVSPSTTYTASYYVKVRDRDYWHNNFLYLVQYTSASAYISEVAIGSASNRIYMGDGWYRVWGTFTTVSNCAKIAVRHYAYELNTAGNEIWFCGSQIEAFNGLTAFKLGSSKGHSRISYTGASLTSNSWQEFSLAMWVKYTETGKHRLSGAWSRFYFGASNLNKIIFSWMENSVNTGNVNTQRSTAGSTTIPINEWIMIGCSVKNNTFINLYLNGNREVNYTNSFYLNASSVDFEINSLTPGNTSNPINGWVKDFIVVNRAISDQEMADLYKNQMRSYKNGTLQVQGMIKEGETL